MKNFFFLLFIPIFLMFSSCSSEDSATNENSLTVNGVKQILDNQEGVTIYYNGGGFSTNPMTGDYTTVYTMVNILDPNHLFLTNFNVTEFNDSLHIRFITHSQTNNGNHKTTNNMQIVAEDKVIAEYFIDGQSSVYANADQKVYIKKSTNQIVIKFSNVTYGSNILSGSFTINY